MKDIDALSDIFSVSGNFPAVVIAEDVRAALSPLEAKGRAARMSVPSHVQDLPKHANQSPWKVLWTKLMMARMMGAEAVRTALAH